MRTKALLFLLFTITLFAVATVITILFNTSPTSSGVIAAFYISLLLSIFGLVFFCFYAYNFYKYGALPPWTKTLTAMRYALFGGLFAVILLLLGSASILNWPTALVLLTLIALTELMLRRKIPLSRFIR